MSRPLSSFCLHRIRSGGTASTAAPPSICANKDDGGGGGGGESRSLKDGKQKDEWEEANEKGSAEAVVVGRKVMVAAADGGGEEARTALQWALSHAVRPCDTVVLLDVASGKNRVRGTFAGGGRQGPGAGDSGGGEEAGRFAPRRGAEEAVRHVAAAVHVDRRRQGRGRGRLHQRRRLLRAARGVHGAGRPAQEPARGRLPHHHQAAEGFLAPGLTIVE
uniref:UspA domain-containing protein n=1 Tax=Zea mays TaxID=4577 RepID=A0A804RDH2_MAIZE